MSPCTIQRDDGQSDRITRGRYASYDEAHAERERYYADLCCSDERVYYRIEEDAGVAAGASGDGAPAPAAPSP
jgi:hypothetical protein